VCRSWRALISNPAFVAAHRSRAQPLLVAATKDPMSWVNSTLEIMDAEGDAVRRIVYLGDHWKFLASLDSFVLLTSRQDSYHSSAYPTVRVIDLVTGEAVATCSIPVDWPAGRGSRLPTWFGFGRAARSGALKVVCIVFPERLTCEVLTLGDNGSSEWRKTTPPSGMICDSSDGVEVNGALHFLSIFQTHILGFDLESEEWTTIHGPSGIIPTPWEKIGLAELNGSLCIARAKRNTVNLWLLLDVNKAVWINTYTIKVGHVVDLVPLRVMCPGGKLLFYYRRGRESILQVYDPRTGKLEKAPTNIVGRIGLCSSHLDRRLRVESLAYVDSHMTPTDITSFASSSSSSSSSSSDDVERDKIEQCNE
jgi:F-box interacting protein